MLVQSDLISTFLLKQTNKKPKTLQRMNSQWLPANSTSPVYAICYFGHQVHFTGLEITFSYSRGWIIYLFHTLFSEINVQKQYEGWWNYTCSHRGEDKAARVWVWRFKYHPQKQIKVQLHWKDVSSSPFRPTMDNCSEAEWLWVKWFISH